VPSGGATPQGEQTNGDVAQQYPDGSVC
jgi:hypothetical protein